MGGAPLLMDVYDRLLKQYGAQGWWPARSPFEVMVGAVLVQATAWSNAEKAISNLRAAGALSASAIRGLEVEALEELVRPSGFFRAKARKLKALCEFLCERYGDDIASMSMDGTERLRRDLLGVYGVGEETADDILLYALGRPVFVVDAYTRRVFGRLGFDEAEARYGEFQALFHERLSRDAALYNEYHALIVRHANSTCRSKPLCEGCPLSAECPRVGV